MRRILAETQAPADSMYSAELLRALVAVRQQHASQPLTAQPVAVELVRAVLRVHYGPKGVTDCMRMSEEIAQTLCDDPSSIRRMERLWDRLSGVRAEA